MAPLSITKRKCSSPMWASTAKKPRTKTKSTKWRRSICSSPPRSTLSWSTSYWPRWTSSHYWSKPILARWLWLKIAHPDRLSCLSKVEILLCWSTRSKFRIQQVGPKTPKWRTWSRIKWYWTKIYSRRHPWEPIKIRWSHMKYKRSRIKLWPTKVHQWPCNQT